MIKFFLISFVIITLFSCGNNEDEKRLDPLEHVTPVEESIEDTVLYPAEYCLDSSWRVSSDVQEGFFLSYTINYKSGKDTTVLLDNNIPIIGGVDYPPAHYINDTTYYVPNIGGSSLGYYQLYIYKNGSCKYVEHISELLSKAEVDSIKEDRINPKPKEWLPVINNTYSINKELILFRRKATFYPNLLSPDSSSSHSIRFKVVKTDSNFIIEGDSLLTTELFYSETSPIHYASGHKPYNGYIKGVKQADNSWLLEIDFWLKLNGKEEKHLKFEERFITY